MLISPAAPRPLFTAPAAAITPAQPAPFTAAIAAGPTDDIRAAIGQLGMTYQMLGQLSDPDISMSVDQTIQYVRPFFNAAHTSLRNLTQDPTSDPGEQLLDAVKLLDNVDSLFTKRPTDFVASAFKDTGSAIALLQELAGE